MAGFAFRFERVLMVRATREKESQRALADAHRRAEIAQESVDTLRRHLKAQEEIARRLAQMGFVEAWRLELYAEYMEGLKGKLDAAEYDLRLKLREVDERREELIAAMKEREILERLKEKDRLAFLLEEERQEQRQTDEVAERMAEGRRRTAIADA